MSLFYQPGISNGEHFLSPEESRHAAKVLRLKTGDELEVADGQGAFYKVRITDPDFSRCSFVILEKNEQTPRKFYTHIAIAPTKNSDRLEWFAEKAIEIGVDKISFIICKNSERKSVNLDRMEKLAVSALKQSRQAWLPAFSDAVPFREILAQPASQKFIAYVDSANPVHLKSLIKPAGNYIVLIGPEGDFSREELQLSLDHDFEKVSLGTSRLRTETAGLVACHILNLQNS